MNKYLYILQTFSLIFLLLLFQIQFKQNNKDKSLIIVSNNITDKSVNIFSISMILMIKIEIIIK